MSIEQKIFLNHKKNLGKRLKFLRESKKYSLNDLAAISNLEKTSISRIENGRTNLTFKTALILCIALKIELKDFFDISIDY